MKILDFERKSYQPIDLSPPNFLARAQEIAPDLRPTAQATLSGLFQHSAHGRLDVLVRLDKNDEALLTELQRAGLLNITDEVEQDDVWRVGFTERLLPENKLAGKR